MTFDNGEHEYLIERNADSIKKYQDEVFKIRNAHADNRARWNDFLTLDGANLIERVRNQVARVQE